MSGGNTSWPDTGSVSFTVSASHICTHKTGWYGKVKFWIFSRRIFTCSDCGKILTGKELKEFKKKRQCR